ncbi:hypothetical protein C5S30_04255 [ANME-1 cluster archaeon GoMg4]|nr:hypothetical protein [ANME-1 cluster archaeon GoMg4]
MRKMDKKGTTVPLTFIIFAAAALVFFASLYLYQNAFVDFPADVAIQQQFNDLGNALSTKTTCAILTLPHEGVVEFTETLPYKIGDHNYQVLIDAPSDEIQLYSFKGYSYNYTLSGMSAEVNATAEDIGACGGTKEVRIRLNRAI